MKKSYVVPTLSSVNKINQTPAFYRDKITHLSHAVDELMANAIHEDSQIETLEKLSNRN